MDLFQSLIVLQKSIKCKLVYFGVFLNTVYVYIIIKMPAMLVFPVNNWYTGLIRTNIRHGKDGEWNFF